MATAPSIVDIKGHVLSVGEAAFGAHMVEIQGRHAPAPMRTTLPARQADDVARARAALADGACLTFLVEERASGPLDGVIVTIC